MRARLTIFLLSAAAGAATLLWGTGGKWLQDFDRAAFQALYRDKTEALLEGHGTNASPWSRRPITPPSARPAPQFLALTDDPERVFESSPHTSGDWAVIFYNLTRLGRQPVAITAPLVWNEGDPVSRAAAETQLAKVPMSTLAAPLARKMQPQPLPPAFIRTSVPLTQVQGDTSLLPQVNDAAVPNLMLQGDHALAGFTHLESESILPYSDHVSGKETRIPLLARWGDRVVFALPVVAVMMRDHIAPEELVIVPGRHLRVGVNGPILPIDAFGTTPLPATKSSPVVEPIEVLIDAETPAALPAPALQLLLDQRTTSSEADRALSASMGDVIAMMDAAPLPGLATTFPRLPMWAEMLMIANFAALTAWFARYVLLYRIVIAVLLLVALAALLIALVETRTLWSAPLPYAVTIFTGLLVSCFFRKRTTARMKQEVAP